MPLKLVAPRKGKTPFWSVRGRYLGHRVNRSTQARKKSVAGKILKKWEAEIERGEFAEKDALTFAVAALAYMNAGGDKTRLAPLLEHFRDTPTAEIDQIAIDNAAAKLFPKGSAPTRNREVYTPVSAVLKHVGVDFRIKRPKGWRGSERTEWLQPEPAFAALAAAHEVDAEFGIFLVTLCYTGLRLSEALKMLINKVELSESFAYAGKTKNGKPRGVFLPPVVVAALANHPRGMNRPGRRVFRFTKCGRLYTLLRATEAACGFKLTFHLFRHTWGAWMRRYAALDTSGLIATTAWKDAASVRRYEHVVLSEESQKAMLLPVAGDTPRSAARVKK